MHKFENLGNMQRIQFANGWVVYLYATVSSDNCGLEIRDPNVAVMKSFIELSPEDLAELLSMVAGYSPKDRFNSVGDLKFPKCRCEKPVVGSDDTPEDPNAVCEKCSGYLVRRKPSQACEACEIEHASNFILMMHKHTCDELSR